MTTCYDLEFGQLTVHEHYLLAKMKFGQKIDVDTVSRFEGIIDRHYGFRDFGYISIRENSYSVNPLVYCLPNQCPNLRAIAVVDPTLRSKCSFPVEKLFYAGEMNFFKKFEEAERWILQKVFEAPKNIKKQNRIKWL